MRFGRGSGLYRDRRQWEQEARLREEAERRKAVELAFRNLLEQQAQQWVLAENLRAFIQECEEQMRSQGADLTAKTWKVNWLAWARQHLERINPLMNGFIDQQKAKRPELLLT